MVRIARPVFVDVPHHITQRGNNRQQVFFTDADYEWYLKQIWSYADQYSLEILAYCLMPTHVHFVSVPHNANSLARTFGLGHMQYTQYFNRRQGLIGHLWQGRFFSAPMGDEYLARAVRYVERNPVRAGLVDTPEAWPWSSAATHLLGKRLSGASYPDDDLLLHWREYLYMDDPLDDLTVIRQRTIAGHPLGGEAFIAELERRSGLSLAIRPRGRPKTT